MGIRRIALVSCVSVKTDDSQRAKDLYISPWFKAAKRYVEPRFDAWAILSARHGLIQPDTVISPYEATLNTMSKDDRDAWLALVIWQLNCFLKPNDEIWLFAGKRYREGLSLWLEGNDHIVRVPLEGLGIGKQLSWFKSQMSLAGL